MREAYVPPGAGLSTLKSISAAPAAVRAPGRLRLPAYGRARLTDGPGVRGAPAPAQRPVIEMGAHRVARNWILPRPFGGT
ncbi:hypothetical protein GCM10023085_53520 [Actinomadura viridis]